MANIDEELRKTFGSNVRAEMARKGWSIEQMAEKSGVKAATIATYTSERSLPMADSLYLLSEALGVTADCLLGR